MSPSGYPSLLRKLQKGVHLSNTINFQIIKPSRNSFSQNDSVRRLKFYNFIRGYFHQCKIPTNKSICLHSFNWRLAISEVWGSEAHHFFLENLFESTDHCFGIALASNTPIMIDLDDSTMHNVDF